jgi:uncharacterized protein YacL (UPF0231 family)
MKTKLMIILIATTISFFCFGQKELKNIDKSVQDIKTNLPSLKKVEKINSKDGTRFVFLQEKELRLITTNALEPTTEKIVEWYFVEEQLAYCETNWFDTTTKNNIFNEKCYLHNGHLISWSNSRDKTIDAASDAFKKMDAELFAYGVKIKEDALK